MSRAENETKCSQGLFKCVILCYPLEINAKHYLHPHEQMRTLQAPRGWRHRELQQEGHPALVCYEFRIAPWKFPIHMLPNQMHVEGAGTRTAKCPQLEGDTYTLRQKGTNQAHPNPEVQTSKVGRLTPRDQCCLGLTVTTETPGLTELRSTKGTGETVSNPTAPHLNFKTKTIRFEGIYKARHI